MKRILSTATLTLVSAIALGGCATSSPLVLSQPIGPRTPQSPAPPTSGELVVYSGWDTFDTMDADHQKHTTYTIHSPGTEKDLRVRNRAGSFGESPESVHLSPGRYLVKALATNVGPIVVPVVIRPGETTYVYLDGVTRPASDVGPNGTNWVRQPNGTIVGWADTGNTR